MFNQLHHIAIICSDYERSKHFYTHILQLPIIHEQYRADKKSHKLDLNIGNIQLELFSFENPPERRSYPEACGLRHLAFAVDHIEETIAYLQAHRIEVEPVRIDPITGKKFTFFQDPDQLPIELYEKE
ncbi:glyoxalase/bleomycin resistance protein/dioxygenase [Anoxybacillus ayderensis]|uniref:SMU1112c/YaeR family gloxylase I-like metalloprotein n=1 Tax=Anoxybacillus ayderensis TaxID=265546 RepID=UPI000385F0A0|nr:VOC family protein [Anoxybacillus ayderensis]EPZ37462.1 glyoxalase/bleomycin resistance protein/dioxygenase [Anoxybacillus ayderensis]KHF29281.1 putative lyase [Anoxybacillus sp. BCO1]MED0656416.1 VOC family protein [Anoxybacillus ayderensis]